MSTIYRVRMLAFENSKPGAVVIREVEIDDQEFVNCDLQGKLEMIYRYGQNDFQAKQCCSVSVGDVIEFNDRLYLVKPHGFNEISERQFSELLALDRRVRSLHAYNF